MAANAYRRTSASAPRATMGYIVNIVSESATEYSPASSELLTKLQTNLVCSQVCNTLQEWRPLHWQQSVPLPQWAARRSL